MFYKLFTIGQIDAKTSKTLNHRNYRALASETPASARLEKGLALLGQPYKVAFTPPAPRFNRAGQEQSCERATSHQPDREGLAENSIHQHTNHHLSPINRIIRQITATKATGIQRGASTHHQDHAITPHSLRPMNRRVRSPKKPMPPEVLLLLLSMFITFLSC